jgi:hypothetical protein
MEVLTLIRSPGGSAETTTVTRVALQSALHMPPRRHVKSVVQLRHTASLKLVKLKSRTLIGGTIMA